MENNITMTQNLIDEYPQASDIERSVVGALMLGRDAISKALEIIGEEQDCFYKRAHSIIYDAIIDLYKEGVTVDQLSLSDRLKDLGQIDLIGGDATIASLAIETASAANVDYHCKILKEKAMLRKIIFSAKSTINACFEKSPNPSNILENLSHKLFTLSDNHISQGYVSLKDSVPAVYDKLVKWSESSSKVVGVPSGFAKLDDITGGWQSGNLVILAGKTSQGKTSLALDFSRNAARQGTPVAFFSMEMSSNELSKRLLSNESRIETSFIRMKNFTKEDWIKLGEGCSRLVNMPIFINDTPAIPLAQLELKLARLIKDHGVGLIVIDYMQLAQGRNKESRRLEIESISRGLKQYAKRYEVPIITLSQLSRKADESEERRPRLSDLRESGSIEQDADVVMFIHDGPASEKKERFKINDPNANFDNFRELIVQKNRNGPTRSILLHWEGKYTKFENLDY